MIKYLALTLLAFNMSAGAAFADLSDADKVEDAIRKAHVINKDYPLRAVISDREATILTRRHPRATDDDLRIDAILMTKAVLDLYQGKIGTVKVLFRDEDSSAGKSVEVTANDIKEYVKSSVDPKKFLATIAVTRVGGDDEAMQSKLSAAERKLTVSAGPLEEERLLLMDRINTLRRKGTGVAPFEALFAQVDAIAKANPAPNASFSPAQSGQLKEAMRALAERLAQQEDLVRQANRTGSGRGISFVKTENSRSPIADPGPAQALPGVTAVSALEKENLQLFTQLEVLIYRSRGEQAHSVYQRKLKDILEANKSGTTADKINSMLISLRTEMGHAQSSFQTGAAGGYRAPGGTGQNERQEPHDNERREPGNWEPGRADR